ncbi:hypothetical protein ATB98_24490 [Sinorhizobium saheli]|uniref:Uncharacterized protein n=1 Tax=Sinorhizobium saheli TaxID=36856 RepID=A0A178Y7P2_SINSA|nr:hypothetical protein [Sinorhizobium saheli]OAP43548.1 hypothetical protein ATB98_24490 [Sinorhizobium saheli]
MVQLVFVHGVATRDTPEYRAAIGNRDTLFRKLLFTGSDVSIHAPMWGQFVPAIPQTVFETDEGVTTYSLNIGPGPGMAGGLVGEVPVAPVGISDATIGAIGKQDPVAALDAICSEIADRAAREARDLNPEELAAFKRAFEVIDSDAAATVFAGEASTETIAEQLKTGPGAFGITDVIGEAVLAVTDRVRNAASTLGFGAVRGNLSPAIGLFLGDVFVYLKDGDVRQRIRAEIGKAVTAAHLASKAGKGPLILIGHSMGGVILVDMLANPRAAGLPDDLKVDALLTVGSQPGFFAVLDLLAWSGAQRKKPGCVNRWLNIFDPIDPLAFRTDTIFEGAEDFSFNSVTGIMEAHSKYFQRPQFYARSRKRLKEFGIL